MLTYDQALRHALQRFVRDGNIDMSALADEFPVGRATLYRVVGSRDRLLGDVLWVLAERTLHLATAEAEAEAATKGVDRFIEISRRFKEHTLSFAPFRRFLLADPETAFRVLLTPAGGVSQRMVAAYADLLTAAAEAGEATLPFDVQRLAYVLVRIGEAMLYSDLLAGLEPDLEMAEAVERQLFLTP